MNKFILVVIMLVMNIAANAAVQTDNHMYIVSRLEHTVLAINRKTGQEKLIKVGSYPREMVIHGDLGYVVNWGSNTVSVIDLKSNDVIRGIPVGERPKQIAIHRNLGYVVNALSNSVSVIELKSNTVIRVIPVGYWPLQIAIHGDLVYVANQNSNNISVIDLKSNTIIHTIPVGERPTQIAIHGNLGYVVNWGSNTISVIDLKSNTVTHTIPVGNDPEQIFINGDLGYVVNKGSNNVSVIDLQRNTVIGTRPNPNYLDIDFSDTHVYLGIKKFAPLYPTLTSLQKMKATGSLGDFITMNPEAFEVGEVKPRDYPKNKNEFDLLPPYVLAQNLFWDVDTDKPLMDPVDILATLITMKYPQKFLKTDPGQWLRKRLHLSLFQAVWLGQTEKAQNMLRYFIQLEDPVMTKLATYKLVKSSATSSGATNSTSK